MPLASIASPWAKPISAGPNAGKPRPITSTVIDQLHAMKQAALTLKHDGYTVIGAVAGEGIPTLQVAADRRTEEAVALDLACYYKQDTLRGMPRRYGQFADKPHGVRVIFVEQPY